MSGDKYPDQFVYDIVNALYKKYTRATDFLCFYYNYNTGKLAKLFQTDQKRWERFRKCVRKTEQLMQKHKIHYTYDKQLGKIIKKELSEWSKNA